jgi:2-polyprenyl-3-methyl-5-hydroxy-6-metoxy-1,4-benzoquinol methylase
MGGMSRKTDVVARVRRYYDALGEDEWTRLTKNVRGRVSLEIHRRFLRRFVTSGAQVLEVGAGPGRFTLELAALGARVVVTDISEVQLAQRGAVAGHRRRASRGGA